MSRFIVNGAKRLNGEICVSGSKNAALPIIFSCIAVRGISELSGVPDISDVEIAFDILRGFGAVVERADDVVLLDTRKLYYRVPDGRLVAVFLILLLFTAPAT